MEQRSISDLRPNPWNTNSVSRESEKKLDESIRRNGLFKPIIVRELPDGGLEIIGGQHRWEACCRLGMDKVPVFNLGVIPEKKAKEISILDNGRYGSDDMIALGELLKEIGSTEVLADFMPFQAVDLESMRKAVDIDLDSLGMDEEDAPVVEKTTKPVKTHMTMRFTVPVANHGFIERVVQDIITREGLDDPDMQINAGNALMRLARFFTDQGGAT